ncbi:MAG: chloride channel protein [Azospirillaceae bacterium]
MAHQLAPHSLQARILVRLRRFTRNEHLILALLAIVVGAIVGGAEIAFRWALQGVQFFGFGSGTDYLASWVINLPWWQIVAVPTVGGLVVGLMVRFLVPGRRPQAVAHVIEASAIRNGRMSLWTGLTAASVSAVSIGAGASVGREGPVVHLGATLASWVGQRLDLTATIIRTLLGCGVAAAIAAAFNAPIAGVFFALEVVVGHYALSAFAPIVMASVIGTMISRLYYGNFPAFVLPESYSIASFWEFPAFVLLGIASAFIATTFMYATMLAEDGFERTRLPRVLRPALAGLLVGLVALELPHVLGVGYETTDLALREAFALDTVLLLLAAKLVLTALCVGGGFGGGVFSPSIFLGAMTGASFGIIATSVFPDLSSGHGAYTLIGMGAVAGAVLGSPISTILIVFEMTGDYELTVAVMLAVVTASIVTEQFVGHSFFTWQLDRRGIAVKGARENRLIAERRVGAVMKRDHAVVPPEMPASDVAEKLRHARYGEVFVLDPEERLIGVITIADLAHAEDIHSGCTARDVARTNPPLLLLSDSIARAMTLMQETGESHIPVVEDRETRRVAGFVHEHDVLLAYHRALLEARAEERGEIKGVRRRKPRGGSGGAGSPKS